MQTIIDTRKPPKRASKPLVPEEIVKKAIEIAGKRKYEEGLELTEWEFQKLVISLADEYNWLWTHNYDNRKVVGRSGFPDLCLLRKDKMIFAELKIGREMPTFEQRKWINGINSFGKKRIYAVVWRPEDYYKIKNELEW